MAEMSESAPMADDRAAANPSPRALTNFLFDEFSSPPVSYLLDDSGDNNGAEHEVQKLLAKLSDQKVQVETVENSTAEREGFRVPSLQLDSPTDVFTIPAGISPTSLLDSPVLVYNTMVQPSPTTGKFVFTKNGGVSPSNQSSSTISDTDWDDLLLEDFANAFAFKHPFGSKSSSFRSNFERMGIPGFKGDSSRLAPKASIQPVKPALTVETEFGLTDLPSRQELNRQAGVVATDDPMSFKMPELPVFDESSAHDTAEGDRDLSSDTFAIPADDGYNWQKYGQKHKKGSASPRSYYKCSKANCEARKKVVRNRKGNVTEVFYKGTHNHPKPPPVHCYVTLPYGTPGDGAQVDVLAQSHSKPGFSDPIWPSFEDSVATEFCDPGTFWQIPENGPSAVFNDEEDPAEYDWAYEDGNDEEGAGTDQSKRMKLEADTLKVNASSKASAEPKIMVKTTSEVDLLDDGYRWRKYGQKIVKGNPNPRSYYKCTKTGCSVRKHVERAANNVKSVITTYEGKHNHELPVTRKISCTSSATLHAATGPRGLVRHVAEPLQGRFGGYTPHGAIRVPGRDLPGPRAVFSVMTGQPRFSELARPRSRPAFSSIRMPSFPTVRSYVPPMHRGPTGPGRMSYGVEGRRGFQNDNLHKQ